MAGQTLRALLEEIVTVPEALVREIGRQVAAGLGAVHEKEIVHRDLKPENVLITEGHRVRIMDLGVARFVDPSVALTREGQFAGSLCYSPPEHFRGATPTPSSDIYFLGVMLYELATGENPFARPDAARVIAAHLDERPAPAREVAGDLSLFLSDILHVLMQKSPDRQFASAAELELILAEGEGSGWRVRRELARARGEARRPRVPVGRDVAAVGRDTEIELLRSSFHEAREGRGRFVLIEGEAGIGKSRLVDVFIEELPTRR